MAHTVKEIVNDALEEILAQAAEEPIGAADGQTAVRYLNDMLFMWDAKGVTLGFTRVDDMGDLVDVPDGAVYGIKKLLAISLAPKFNATVDEILYREAASGWEAILDLTFNISEMNFPSILPTGSGNNIANRYSANIFYPAVTEAILTETNGFIATEANTEVT